MFIEKIKAQDAFSALKQKPLEIPSPNWQADTG